MQAVTVAHRVRLVADGKLGLRVLAADCPHCAAADFGRYEVHGGISCPQGRLGLHFLGTSLVVHNLSAPVVRFANALDRRASVSQTLKEITPS